MESRRIDFSPLALARTGGALYLVIIVLGLFAEMFVRGRLVVPGDAAATALRLASDQRLWRLGIVAEYVALFCTTGLAMIYFVLLRPVNRPINLLATFLRLVGIAVQSGAVLFLIAALFPLRDVSPFTTLTPDVRHALMSMAIKTHAQGFGVALLFTGCTFLFHGHLISRSGFLPRILGIMIQIAGVAYLTSSFALIVDPDVAVRLSPAILLPPFVAEVSLSLWLLVKGVDVEKWLVMANR